MTTVDTMALLGIILVHPPNIYLRVDIPATKSVNIAQNSISRVSTTNLKAKKDLILLRKDIPIVHTEGATPMIKDSLESQCRTIQVWASILPQDLKADPDQDRTKGEDRLIESIGVNLLNETICQQALRATTQDIEKTWIKFIKIIPSSSHGWTKVMVGGALLVNKTLPDLDRERTLTVMCNMWVLPLREWPRCNQEWWIKQLVQLHKP